MYCTACGHELEENHNYCPNCGKPVKGRAPRPTFQSAAGKRLVRPMHKKSIAGVCAGFADYLDVDVTLMRIIWLGAALFTGVGFIAYVICWIVMPKDWGPAEAAGPAPQAKPAPEAAGEPKAGGETAAPRAGEETQGSSPVA